MQKNFCKPSKIKTRLSVFPLIFPSPAGAPAAVLSHGLEEITEMSGQTENYLSQ